MPETEVVINYDNIISRIGYQFQEILYALRDSEDEQVRGLMQNITAIEISDEQNFVKKRKSTKLLETTIYIAVRFSSGGINFASSVSPVSLFCVGTSNKVKPAQMILGVFASAWTTKNLAQGLTNESNESLEISDVLQVWNTPEIISNFNEVDTDFKNLFRLTGNIVIGPKAVRLGTLTFIYDEEAESLEPGTGSETINFMSFQDNFTSNLDSQPFGNTHGFSKSEVNFSTYVFSITTFLLNNHLTAAALSARGFKNVNGGLIDSNFKANDKMKIKLEFTNGFSNIGDGIPEFFGYYKVISSQIGQEIAGIPSLAVSFTR